MANINHSTTRTREELFEDAVDSLTNAWYCEDSGDSGSCGRKWAHFYVQEIAKEYGGSFEEVYKEVVKKARKCYSEEF